MVRSNGRGLWATAVVLAALLGGSTCKVINEDHCANQDIPGNDFCVQLSPATPYCSPCNRDLHGCVDFEPFACPGYSNEIGDSSIATGTGEMPTDGASMGTDADGASDGMTGAMTSG